jgi:hypothetical protein
MDELPPIFFLLQEKIWGHKVYSIFFIFLSILLNFQYFYHEHEQNEKGGQPDGQCHGRVQ